MYEPEPLLSDIEDECRLFFDNSTFHFNQVNFNKWKVIGDYATKARNEDRGKVDVINWFDDFWIYLEIEFHRLKEDFPNVFISLSVFQGKPEDQIKDHLFRAEWDNYEGNEIHPQPHWHFYPVRYSHKIREDFETFIKLVDKEDEGFEAQLGSEATKVIDLKNIHFAMNGRWDLEGSHIHRVKDEKTIIYWLKGLFGHLKSQLEYVG